MSNHFIEDQTFSNADYSQIALPKGNYENCGFSQCNFSNSDLSSVNFADCQFTSCNLSLSNISKTAFQNVKFRDCKLLGLHFQNSNPFLLSLYFENCILNLSSFYKVKLRKTLFKNCTLQEADFSEADLSAALFDNCDLSSATFDQTLLEKADFRSSWNYTIDPESNRIKKARFSLAGLPGLLAKYQIDVE